MQQALDRDERFSPPEWFQAMELDEPFEIDVCAPVGYGRHPAYHVPAKRHFTTDHDGLRQEWEGFIWMNPPFGGRNEIEVWLEKFVDHGNGIGVCWGRTASGWFQKYMPSMQCLLFVKGKRHFLLPDGSACGCPKDGIVLYGIGYRAINALGQAHDNGLGIFTEVRA